MTHLLYVKLYVTAVNRSMDASAAGTEGSVRATDPLPQAASSPAGSEGAARAFTTCGGCKLALSRATDDPGCQNRRVISSRPPASGELLISTAAESDDFFNQSVVLLLDCDPDGVVGLALNKLADTALESVLPQWMDLVAPPQALFAGGPVSPNGAVCLAKVANPAEDPPGWRRVTEDIGLLHLDTPVELASGGYTDLRIYAGYAGWAAGQLEEELARGMWYRSAARDEDIFTAEPSGLWRRVLRRQGGQAAFWSTWAPDPELN